MSARETMMSGEIQYSLLRMTTLPLSLPRTGVIAPSTIFSILMMRVSPLRLVDDRHLPHAEEAAGEDFQQARSSRRRGRS